MRLFTGRCVASQQNANEKPALRRARTCRPCSTLRHPPSYFTPAAPRQVALRIRTCARCSSVRHTTQHPAPTTTSRCTKELAWQFLGWFKDGNSTVDRTISADAGSHPCTRPPAEFFRVVAGTLCSLALRALEAPHSYSARKRRTPSLNTLSPTASMWSRPGISSARAAGSRAASSCTEPAIVSLVPAATSTGARIAAT
jgi:hypothetical protein